MVVGFCNYRNTRLPFAVLILPAVLFKMSYNTNSTSLLCFFRNQFDIVSTPVFNIEIRSLLLKISISFLVIAIYCDRKCSKIVFTIDFLNLRLLAYIAFKNERIQLIHKLILLR